MMSNSFFMLHIYVSFFPLVPFNLVSLLHEESSLLSWDWYWECLLCGNRWKVMGTGSRSLVGGGGNSYFLKRRTNICPLLSTTECLKSVSLRGKMIPEELEKQVWQARTEVRGVREKGGKKMCACVWLWGRGCQAGNASSQTHICVWDREEDVRIKIR